MGKQSYCQAIICFLFLFGSVWEGEGRVNESEYFPLHEEVVNFGKGELSCDKIYSEFKIHVLKYRGVQLKRNFPKLLCAFGKADGT